MCHAHLPAPTARLRSGASQAPPVLCSSTRLCLSFAATPLQGLSTLAVLLLTSNLLSSSLLPTRSVPRRASHQGNVSRGCPGDTWTRLRSASHVRGLAAAQSPHTRSPSFRNLTSLPECRGFEAWLSCPVAAPWGRPLSLALLEREVHGLPSPPPHGSGGPSCR